MTLNLKAFTLACGILWGGTLLFIAWWIMLFDGAGGNIPLLGQIYRGYDLTPTGSFIGLLWGFVDGCIGGFILGAVYNLLAGKGRGE